ncbi:glycosyltransferase family 2 protein [Flavobacterium sp.]|uniref:glycosyltransferase family 2 protein n=1 Tax=Flavobacterium sp. TaxID=239 RepID=UPI00375362E5
MITLVLTNRNRDLRIVKNCLNSLTEQSLKEFQVILVDYGSDVVYVNGLQTLVQDYSFIQLITCPVQGQLWNKSRAINIALQQTSTPYFLVGDIDLIFHPDFIKIALQSISINKIVYFQYGFLSKEESLLCKKFEEFKVAFLGNNEITGTTLFPTDKLKEVNGFDEFYHGWGAEDTDIHIRLRNIGLGIVFYSGELLIKHQWHPKAYRSKESSTPFHSKLEQTNHSYIQFTASSNRTKVNLQTQWGKMPLELDYRKLANNPNHSFQLLPEEVKLSALLAQFKNFEKELVSIVIKEVSSIEKAKQFLKKVVGKKYNCYLEMEEMNNSILEEIIINYRNLPYSYSFDRQKKEIQLLIQF